MKKIIDTWTPDRLYYVAGEIHDRCLKHEIKSYHPDADVVFECPWCGAKLEYVDKLDGGK